MTTAARSRSRTANSWRNAGDDILARLDIRAELEGLGVRFAGKMNGDSWAPCHAIDREDRDPSAAVNLHTGRYRDHGGNGLSLSFFDLAAQLGKHPDWKAARAAYAAKAGVKLPNTSPPADPAEHLRFTDWNHVLAALWCRHKPGVTPEAIQAAGGRLARYRDQYAVVALPVLGEALTDADPVGWVLWNQTGRELPIFQKSGPPLWKKMKTTAGSEGGLMGLHGLSRLGSASSPAGQTAWSVEGPTDLMALWAAIPPELRGTHLMVCNSGGAAEGPKNWMSAAFTGRRVVVTRDADAAGEAGAGKWTAWLAGPGGAAEVRQLRLPYPIVPDHGEDLRDWLNEGHTFADLLALVEAAPVIKAGSILEPLGNFTTEPDGDGEKIVPLPMCDVLERIRRRTGDWPRRVGGSLFVHDGERGICWLLSPAALFGWLAGRCGTIEWSRVQGCVSREETFCEMQRTSPECATIENLPHEPAMIGHYYACKTPEPGDGTALNKLLDFHKLETPADRDLLACAYATPAWGGPPGSRPGFMFTATSGRGKGKSSAAQNVIRVYRDAIDVSPSEDIGVIKQRLLTAEAAWVRIALLDNVKTTRFSWGELEGLITADQISGKRLYVGNASRPNCLTWLVTLNGASLSTDMAQRVVEIRLGEPDYASGWEERVATFIDQNREQILGDLVAFLRRPAKTLRRHTRWAAWEGGVLSKTADPDALVNLILDRRGQTDVEQEEGAIIEDFFGGKLRWLGYDIETADVFVPNEIVLRWYNQATGDNRKTTGVTRALRQMRDEGRLHQIVSARVGELGQRGFRWVGRHSDSAAPTQFDLRHRLKEKLSNQASEAGEVGNEF